MLLYKVEFQGPSSGEQERARLSLQTLLMLSLSAETNSQLSPNTNFFWKHKEKEL